MQLESNMTQEFADKLLTFVVAKAIYQEELPSAAMGRTLINLDDTILPNAAVKALGQIDAMQKEFQQSKEGFADRVVNLFKDLSQTAENFGKMFIDAQKSMDNDPSLELVSAVRNSMNMAEHIGKMDFSREAVFQRLNIDPNAKPVLNETQQQTGKDQSIKM